MITDLQTSKSRCLADLVTAMSGTGYRSRLDSIDTRLAAYIDDALSGEASHANLYELLGIRKVLRLMDAYRIDADRVRRTGCHRGHAHPRPADVDARSHHRPEVLPPVCPEQAGAEGEVRGHRRDCRPHRRRRQPGRQQWRRQPDTGRRAGDVISPLRNRRIGDKRSSLSPIPVFYNELHELNELWKRTAYPSTLTAALRSGAI